MARGLLRRDGGPLPPRALGAGALVAGLASAVVHRLYGHAETSPEPMPGGEFLVNHPAYGLVLLLAVVALLPVARTRGGAGSTGGR